MPELSAPSESARARASQGAVIMLAVLAGIGALWLGREVFVPLSIALVLATVLRPVVARLERMRVPTAVAAALVVIASIAIVVGIGLALESPVRDMASDLPKSISAARTKLDAMTARLRKIGSASKPAQPAQPAQSASSPVSGAAPQNAEPASSSPPRSEGSAGGPGGAQAALRSAFGLTTSLLSEIVEEVLLVFFLLAAGRAWMDKLARITTRPNHEHVWPSIAGEMHDVVARYLIVTLLINAAQAIIIGLALWALGVPTPLLWGALTFVAEFVPYLGGIVMIVLLAAAGLAGNQGVTHALLAPAAYLIITTLQNNLVSPIAYGRGLRLNPTVILLGVMFWWMIWGVAGAFLAVPILASMRVLGSRIPGLKPMAVLLEE